MKRGGPQHPKVVALSRRLGVPRFAAVGVLESLWHFAAGYAHAGDVGRFSDAVIAEAIGWDRAPAELIQALVAERMLDSCACHRLRVHGWPEHADQTVSRVLSKQNRGFLSCYDDPSSVLAPSQHETSQPSPCLALPSLAIPEPARKPARSARAKTDPPLDLEPGEKKALEGWCREKHPDLASRLGALTTSCLDFHRSKGNRHADWTATVRTWVRNEAEGRFGIPRRAAGTSPPALGSRAERRERAKHLYTIDQLLPDDTEEALVSWEAAGCPKERAWWLPEEERRRLRVVS